MRMNSFNPPNRCQGGSSHHPLIMMRMLRHRQVKNDLSTVTQFLVWASTSLFTFVLKCFCRRLGNLESQQTLHLYKGKMSEESRARRERSPSEQGSVLTPPPCFEASTAGSNKSCDSTHWLGFSSLRHFELGFCPCVRTQVPFRRAVVWSEDDSDW